MVVCGRTGSVAEHLLLPWRTLATASSYGPSLAPPPSAMATESSTTTWPPPPTFGIGGAFAETIGGGGRGLKRSMSDSDMDDVFDDSSSKGTPTQSNDSCQLLNRKKRRGIIEKRRRDRINSSLTELRRLVPTAFEKQGSAKLEKAEILQMTVDHLKMLHAKGFDAFSFDPHKFATDYHSIGFRECAAEVARYLVTVEGMDIQDPLRLRLMSHLQCYSAQRELVAKQAAAANPPWNAFSGVAQQPPPSSAVTPSSNSSQFPPAASSSSSSTTTTTSSTTTTTNNPIHPQAHHHPHLQHLHHHNPNSESSHQSMTSGVHHLLPSLSCSDSSSGGGGSMAASHMRLVPHGHHPPPPLAPPVGGNVHGHHGGSAASMTHSLGQMHSQYPVSININTNGFTSMSSPSGYSPSSTTQSGHSVKPYRPWGTELAY